MGETLNPTLYDTDFYAWTQRQVALLQAEEFEAVEGPSHWGDR